MSADYRRGNGSAWLVPLADLSLILFIITAAGLAATQRDGDRTEQPQQAGAFAQGVAAAIFVDAPGGPSLADWLAGSRPGPGEQLTIEARFVPADRDRVVRRAEELALEAISAGEQPRVILQPLAAGSGPSLVQATIAHDADPPSTR